MKATLHIPVEWPKGWTAIVPDWHAAWIDPGGAVWGPGPYLKVPAACPEDSVQRVHCPLYPGDILRGRCERTLVLRLVVTAVAVERDGEGWVWRIDLADQAGLR